MKKIQKPKTKAPKLGKKIQLKTVAKRAAPKKAGAPKEKTKTAKKVERPQKAIIKRKIVRTVKRLPKPVDPMAQLETTAAPHEDLIVAAKSKGRRKILGKAIGGLGWQLPTAVIGGAVSVAMGLWLAYAPIRPPSPAELTNSAPAQVERAIASEPAQAAPAEQPAQPEQVSQAAPVPEAPAAAPAQAEPVATATTAAVASPTSGARFADTTGMSVSDRVSFWTDYLWKNRDTGLGLPIKSTPPKVLDTAPLLTSSFDCTTFVETVAALSRSKTDEEFFNNLIAIRYGADQTSYADRNHFPEADWIPNNVKKGIIRDATQRVALSAGIELKTETKSIDKASWIEKQFATKKVSRSIASVPANWSTPVPVSISYIPLEDAEKALPHIPSGAIVNVVRKSDERFPVLISHQGFVVKDRGTVYLRHVSQAGKIRVVPLKKYLNDIQADGDSKWPLAGLNFYLLNDA